jgi:hypothetical protein
VLRLIEQLLMDILNIPAKPIAAMLLNKAKCLLMQKNFLLQGRIKDKARLKHQRIAGREQAIHMVVGQFDVIQ